MSSNARPVNPPWAQRAAVKPVQLELARRAGLRVPDTLITNDRPVDRDDLADLIFPPTIFLAAAA